MKTFSVPPESAGLRLDQFMTSQEPTLSRSRLQALIKEGAVTLNGASTKPNAKVREADEVRLTLPEVQKTETQAEEMPLSILYEDADLLVVDKPAGLVVHPAVGNWSGTLVNALLHHCRGLSVIGGEERPGIVHRLDKETSGCIVVAKTDVAHQGLSRQFATREVDKIYLALCAGRFAQARGTVEVVMGRHPVHRQRMAVLADGRGRTSKTDWRVLGEIVAAEAPSGLGTLVECTLHTGRTHQIRVHLKHLGHPLLGDEVYGRRLGFARQMLHAWRLCFTHPVTGERVRCLAPLPADFQQAGVGVLVHSGEPVKSRFALASRSGSGKIARIWPMSDYETALHYVHDVLGELQKQGVTLTAPLPVLAALAAQGAVAAPATGARAKVEPSAGSTAQAPARLLPAETATPVSRRVEGPASGSPRPRPSVPVLPPLPPFVPSIPVAPVGTRAERLTAWREAARQGAVATDLLQVAHPHIAFGAGQAGAELLFIGEAPGEEETLEQDPLATEAGGILAKMITAMGLSPEEVYIAQMLRVRPEKRGRPSEHRLPTAEERQAGLQRLRELIAILEPRVLVALGASAVEGLLGLSDSIGKVRSQWLDYRGTPLLATYHPAYLARNQAISKKREVWTDMLMVLEKLGRPISEKQRAYFLPK